MKDSIYLACQHLDACIEAGEIKGHTATAIRTVMNELMYQLEEVKTMKAISMPYVQYQNELQKEYEKGKQEANRTIETKSDPFKQTDYQYREKCPSCGNEYLVIFTRNMIATRICECGHKWVKK